MIKDLEGRVINMLRQEFPDIHVESWTPGYDFFKTERIWPSLFVQYSGSKDSWGAGEQYMRELSFVILIAVKSLKDINSAKLMVYEMLDRVRNLFGHLYIPEIGVIKIEGDEMVWMDNARIVWGVRLTIKRWWRHE